MKVVTICTLTGHFVARTSEKDQRLLKVFQFDPYFGKSERRRVILLELFC